MQAEEKDTTEKKKAKIRLISFLFISTFRKGP
jgi:hypothetical protein